MKKIKFKKPNPKKIIKWVIILGIIIFIVFSVVKKMHPAKQAQEAMTSKAVISKVETAISGNGTLNPANQYDVKSLVKGEIIKAPFEEGSNVEKGDVLYEISTSDLSNSIKTAQLGVDKAKLAYKDSLDKKNGLKITTRYSGYVKNLYVKSGDTIQAGGKIADIYNDDIMYIDLLFPSNEVKNSWMGRTASLTMDATAEIVKGKVTKISNMKEVMDGGILAKKVTISVKNAGGIKDGDNAEATIGGVTSNNSGTFRAKTETTILAHSEGKINGIFVKEGKWANKGDTILTLSSKDYKSQLKTARMGITEAQLSLNTQKDQMKQYTIKAPISGQVITKTKKLGDTIDPAADTQAGPMATIYDMSYLTFQLNIDELQIHNVKVGQKVSITTQAFPGKTYYGVVDRISLKGNTKDGVTSYPVIVKVTDFGNLLPSMNVTGKIIIEHVDDVLTIPSSALQRGNMVYVKTKDAVKKKTSAKGKKSDVPAGFKAVKVTIGLNDGSNVEIKSGLNKGDKVYVPFNDSADSMSGMTGEGME